MNILLLGSGGREHALAWRIAQSAQCGQLFIAPGNPGMTELGTCLPEIKVNDFAAIEALVRREQIELLVVGPEDPLVNGIVDHFRAIGDFKELPIVGPDASGARLEGSKDFSKAFMQRHNIPTAAYRSFRVGQTDEAIAFLHTLRAPYVLKADGLAAGKGVIIAETLAEAESELREMLAGRFGAASACVVIEEFLSGIECSVFVTSDGKDYRILPVAKDYKRIGEGDTGLNTGGMGSVSPVVFADDTFMAKVEERVVSRTLAGLRAEGIDYRGFIFVGLMNVAGEPYVIEYNCRMGDPETESVMLRLSGDFVELLMRMATASLGDYQIQIDPRVATTVVLVSRGYPGSYEKGFEITLPELSNECLIFHAGTVITAEGKLVTNGGRVLTASCYGDNIEQALERCYALADEISFEGKTLRRDIGADLLELM
ncbi:phosphoribosylamine--glycine ligase [Porphyromonas sp. COT-290 OH3588]|uniref:phosphoribosylamine--glycine ligase n=1 Tax=Porphyromonas sp. COT-290 OH3588 TaxID=1515617 RepID=UPI00052D882C|nr:phosphoribosylamine--glycine ligase [Porphyromonas sp. COT-290 OH3588]KGN97311.1 phosphoribosylamine--glycine ligase [Porphyromonas sp. COT-290 OH3588]